MKGSPMSDKQNPANTTITTSHKHIPIKTIIAVIVAVVLGLGVGIGGTAAYVASQPKPETIVKVVPTASEKDSNLSLMRGNTLAAIYAQQSGEIKALRYEAYNSAMRSLDIINSEPKKDADKPYAVSLDLDETVLDNSLFSGHGVHQGEQFNPKTWGEWVKEKRATLVQGAKEFTDYAKSCGWEVYYVSNRDEKTELEPTLENMKALGLVNADKQHVLLKTTTSDKHARWEEIEKTNNLVMWCGDNLTDFPDGYEKKSNENRSVIVQQNKNEFGKRYIMLPNPTYGDFESALYEYNHKLTAKEKEAARLKALQSFKNAQSQSNS